MEAIIIIWYVLLVVDIALAAIVAKRFRTRKRIVYEPATFWSTMSLITCFFVVGLISAFARRMQDCTSSASLLFLATMSLTSILFFDWFEDWRNINRKKLRG